MTKKVFLKSSPWIILEYLYSDEEMDEKGWSAVNFICMVCWQEEYFEFDLITHEMADEIESKYGDKGHPDFRSQVKAFEKAHQHPGVVHRGKPL